MKRYFVYVLTNKNNKIFYVGMTSDLEKRIWEHKNRMVDGFTEKYNLKKLVWFGEGVDVNEIIRKEKQIKKWNKEWKKNLVEKSNPEWKDLSLGF